MEGKYGTKVGDGDSSLIKGEKTRIMDMDMTTVAWEAVWYLITLKALAIFSRESYKVLAALKKGKENLLVVLSLMIRT